MLVLDHLQVLGKSVFGTDITSPHQVGILAAPSSSNEAGLEIDLATASASNHVFGLAVNAEHSLAANNTGRITGVYSSVLLKSAGRTADSIAAHRAIAGTSNTATGSTAASAVCYWASPYYQAGTVTSLYGFYMDTGATGGSVSSLWGVYIGNSDANNYFAGKVGIGTTPSYWFTLSYTHLNTADSVLMSLTRVYANPGASSSADFTAGNFQSRVAAGNAQNFTSTDGMTAIRTYALHEGTGSVTVLHGVRSFVQTLSTGTVSSGIAFRATLSTTASSNITTAYGLYVDTPAGSGTIGNLWGVYVNPDTAANYFAGQVRLGTTSTSNWVFTSNSNLGAYKTGTWGATPACSIEAVIDNTYAAGTNSTQTCAIHGKATISGAATFAGTIGCVGVVGMAYSATPTAVTGWVSGMASYIRKTGTGVVASASAMYCQLRNENATGAITDGYGVYIAPPSLTGSITNEWGLYVASTTAKNYFAGVVSIGDSAPASNYYGIRQVTSTTHTSSWRAARSLVNVWTPSGALSASSENYSFDLQTSSAGSANMSAASCVLYGQRIVASHNGTGVLTELRGLDIYSQKTNTGALTTAYGLRVGVNNTNVTGAITNAYGVYISGFTTTGAITNRWGLYQAGASELNYFAGNTGLATTSPQGLLHLNGRLHFSELTSNPSADELTSTTYSYPTDRCAIYMKADKLVIAYVLGTSTVRYLYLTLNAANTTWVNTTTAP